MAVSNGLRRLLRIRDLEEEQQRLALESALGDLRALEHALVTARAREREGRAHIAQSVQSTDPADRLSGLVEADAGGRRAASLRPRIVIAAAQAAKLRQQFLVKRVDRRQAETLIRETEVQDAVVAVRRGQQNLDEWFRARAWATDEERDTIDRQRADRHEMRTGKDSGESPEEGIESHP